MNQHEENIFLNALLEVVMVMVKIIQRFFVHALSQPSSIRKHLIRLDAVPFDVTFSFDLPASGSWTSAAACRKPTILVNHMADAWLRAWRTGSNLQQHLSRQTCAVLSSYEFLAGSDDQAAEAPIEVTCILKP